VVIGTSAGSLVGALLRNGFDAEDLWAWAQGTHPELAGGTPEEVRERRLGLMVPGVSNPFDLIRRLLGSAWVISRSLARFPMLPMPAFVAHLFPAGVLSMREAKADLGSRLGDAWPERPTWLVSVDITSGRRVVYGRPGSPEATLTEAVMASCAIPGVYPPVKVGHRVLVDGGVDSTTHLDLAVKAGCDLVIGVVPMAFDVEEPPKPLMQLFRRVPSRWLADEVAYARARGCQVLLFRPTATELAVHGSNLMRSDGWETIADAAYAQTTRLLATPRFVEALGPLLTRDAAPAG